MLIVSFVIPDETELISKYAIASFDCALSKTGIVFTTSSPPKSTLIELIPFVSVALYLI